MKSVCMLKNLKLSSNEILIGGYSSAKLFFFNFCRIKWNEIKLKKEEDSAKTMSFTERFEIDILHLYLIQKQLVNEWPWKLKEIKFTSMFWKLHEKEGLYCLLEFFCSIENMN